MSRRARAVWRAFRSVALAAVVVTLGTAQAGADDSVTRAIRAQRAAFNDAVRTRRFAELEATLLPEDFALTAPGPKTVIGSARNIAFLERLAQRRPDLEWRFTPERIDGYAPWGVASETGTWVERWAEKDGPVELRGRYFASWVFSKGAWRQLALTFSPTACIGGEYCGPSEWDLRSPRPAPSPR